MRSTRRLSSLLVAAILLLPSTAVADACKEAQPATTPCEGILMPTPWAMESVQCKKVQVPLCLAEKDQLAAQLRLVRFDLDQSRLAATRGWYEHPVLWAVIGAVGASALLISIR